jgi:hypothetical protein
MPGQWRAVLHRRLEHGFWFPLFTTVIRRTYEHLSLCRRWNRFLRDVDGASESYQVVAVLAGAVWLALIRNATPTILHTSAAVKVGGFVALYRVTEIFVFSIHWVFVAELPLSRVRRSLAGFLVNLLELPVFFAIAFALLDCSVGRGSVWSLFYEHLRSVWTLDLTESCGGAGCRLLAHYEMACAGLVLLIVVASLVGGVLRPELADTRSEHGPRQDAE